MCGRSGAGGGCWLVEEALGGVGGVCAHVERLKLTIVAHVAVM